MEMFARLTTTSGPTCTNSRNTAGGGSPLQGVITVSHSTTITSEPRCHLQRIDLSQCTLYKTLELSGAGEKSKRGRKADLACIQNSKTNGLQYQGFSYSHPVLINLTKRFLTLSGWEAVCSSFCDRSCLFLSLKGTLCLVNPPLSAATNGRFLFSHQKPSVLLSNFYKPVELYETTRWLLTEADPHNRSKAEPSASPVI